MMWEMLAPMTISLGFFALIGWVAYVIVDGRRRRERLKVFTDFHGKLIDRLGSAQEFGDFLQSQGGQRFLATLSTERGGPQAGILRSVHAGLVLLALGGGLLLLKGLGEWSYEGEAFLLMCGVLALSLAVGFVLSAGASWRLAQSLGLMGHDRDDIPGRSAA